MYLCASLNPYMSNTCCPKVQTGQKVGDPNRGEMLTDWVGGKMRKSTILCSLLIPNGVSGPRWSESMIDVFMPRI